MALREIQRRVEWVLVSNKWTRISIMGTNLSERNLKVDNLGDEEDRSIILLIPGNPGNEAFYSDFAERTLKELLAREERMASHKQQYLIFTVSHLNHVSMPVELKHSGQHKFNDRLTLTDQIQHKLDFVKQYLPRGARVHMFGHSIGSYMLLKILPYIKEDFNLKKVVCLFPTVERMALSPNGVRLRKILSTLNANDWLAKALSFWLDVLPLSLKRYLVSWNLSGNNIPESIIHTSTELLYMNVFRNIVHMSDDELENVNEFDENLLIHKDIIYFYYGVTDGWCPIDYAYDMEKRVDKGHVIIDDEKCEHAFVIRDGQAMAKKMLTFIN